MCPPAGVSVILRIEGKTRTIFEGWVATTYHRVTTRSGGTRHCNGMNNDNNPCPGPTCITALDDASKIAGFAFDGDYYESFDDFLIKSIGGDTPGTNEFWSMCLNFRPTTVGGCQQIVRQDDQILFAYANSAGNNRTTTYLRLFGPKSAVPGDVTLTVTDGKGAPVNNVAVKHPITNIPFYTDADGKVKLATLRAGNYKIKAEKPDNLVSIRSNQHYLVVQ